MMTLSRTCKMSERWGKGRIQAEGLASAKAKRQEGMLCSVNLCRRHLEPLDGDIQPAQKPNRLPSFLKKILFIIF